MARVPKAPSWPAVIISGIAGGIVNWMFDSQALGLVTFMTLTSLSLLFRKHESA